MLDAAIKHKDKLKILLASTWFDEKYKYYHLDWAGEFELSESNWNLHQFVSIDSNGDIIGYMGYNVDRTAYYAKSLAITNFRNDTPSKFTFGQDVFQAIKNIFKKFNFNKLVFECVVGNPVQKTYRRLINDYNGRIVGVFKQHVILQDGQMYDIEMYEITKEGYEEALHFIANEKAEKVYQRAKKERQEKTKCVHSIKDHCYSSAMHAQDSIASESFITINFPRRSCNGYDKDCTYCEQGSNSI